MIDANIYICTHILCNARTIHFPKNLLAELKASWSSNYLLKCFFSGGGLMGFLFNELID